MGDFAMVTRACASLLALALAVGSPVRADARGGSSRSYSSGARSSSHGSSRSHSSGGHATGTRTRSYGGTHKKATGVQRDSHGKIKRSESAKNSFKKAHPCPSTGKSSGACPGYVVDHVRPLKRGGADAPSNMQWQTKEAAKAKDRWE